MKYLLGLVLALVLVPAVSFADVEGCEPSFAFSPLTGERCSDLPAGCEPGYLFSTVTGQSCTVSNEEDESEPTPPKEVTSTVDIGELWIAGSRNGFQVTLANFTQGKADLEVTPPEGMIDSGKSGTTCSGGICTYIGRFILEGETYQNARRLPTDRTYTFIIKAFGKTYTSELEVDQEKTLHYNRNMPEDTENQSNEESNTESTPEETVTPTPRGSGFMVTP